MSDFIVDPYVLAGEYVLGTLEYAERLEAELRQEREPEFAQAVAFWEDHLTPLSGLVTPVAPPAQLWSRLALATGVRDVPAPRAAGSSRFWQGTTVAAMLVAAGLAVVAFLPGVQNGGAPGVRLAAALAPLNVAVPFLAETRPDGRIVVTGLTTTPAAQGRTFQLWELPAGATVPISLGLLTPGQPNVIPSNATSLARAQLLISDEPTGGSPTGQPTGSVLFGGTLSPVAQPGQ